MKPTINLASRTYINRSALRTGTLVALSALLCWLLVAAFLVVRDIGYLADLNEKMAELHEQRVELRGGDEQAISAGQLDKRREEVIFINRLLEQDSYRWTELLSQLEEHAFSGVVIRSIQPDFKDRTLAIRGYARDLVHLRRFIDNLIESHDYREVYLLDQVIERFKDSSGIERDAISFNISLVQGD